MGRMLTREQIQAAQQERAKYLVILTQKAREGDFEAFRERQHTLSRDPVDLGIEWEQFQREARDVGSNR